MLAHTHQRGDTIIEVLLALAVFSLLAVGVMTVMTQSSNAAQRALEITLVRQQVDAQVEALRASHQAYSRLLTADSRAGSVWQDVTTRAQSSGHIDSNVNCPTRVELTKKRVFAMNSLDATVIDTSSGLNSIQDADAPVFAQALSDEGDLVDYGIWIEAEKVTSLDPHVPGAYNFRVRACWSGAGTSRPMQLETTVRLYDDA